jgi:hypothetical protein
MLNINQISFKIKSSNREEFDTIRTEANTTNSS